MKYAIVIIAAIALTGCRAVTSKSSITNNFTAGGNIVVKDSGTTASQEGTQAADKEVGDISPNTSVSPL